MGGWGEAGVLLSITAARGAEVEPDRVPFRNAQFVQQGHHSGVRWVVPGVPLDKGNIMRGQSHGATALHQAA